MALEIIGSGRSLGEGSEGQLSDWLAIKLARRMRLIGTREWASYDKAVRIQSLAFSSQRRHRYDDATL